MTGEFRIIPPDARGYPGLTALKLTDGRELAAMGVGAEVERMLGDEAIKRVKGVHDAR
jgi:hypothetical protein